MSDKESESVSADAWRSPGDLELHETAAEIQSLFLEFRRGQVLTAGEGGFPAGALIAAGEHWQIVPHGVLAARVLRHAAHRSPFGGMPFLDIGPHDDGGPAVTPLRRGHPGWFIARGYGRGFDIVAAINDRLEAAVVRGWPVRIRTTARTVPAWNATLVPATCHITVRSADPYCRDGWLALDAGRGAEMR
jgi:hypothetical protein